MTHYSIGIDLGGTKILGGIINTKTGEVIEVAKKKTKKDNNSDSISQRVEDTIEKLFRLSGLSIDKIESIGIGVAGQVNRSEGILIAAPNLGCVNVEFKKILEKKYNKPVSIGNDVETATIGEMYFGSGRNCSNFVCIFIGTGIGSGIVQNGKIYQGYTGTAGEIGHITIQPNGRHCACGNNGCLEAYSSRTAISKKIAAKIKSGKDSILKSYYVDNPNFTLRSKHIKAALDVGDELTIDCLNEAIEYFSIGLASIINFYNPQKIIIGGGLIEAVDFFFNSIEKKVKSRCLPVPANRLIIEKTTLGDYAGIVGAVIMANKDFIKR